MKAQLYLGGSTLLIDSQDAYYEQCTDNIIPFPVVKRVQKLPCDEPGEDQLFGLAIKASQKTSAWEGIGFLSLELAAMAAVTISLVRALQ